jgi:hypothetical protein
LLWAGDVAIIQVGDTCTVEDNPWMDGLGVPITCASTASVYQSACGKGDHRRRARAAPPKPARARPQSPAPGHRRRPTAVVADIAGAGTCVLTVRAVRAGRICRAVLVQPRIACDMTRLKTRISDGPFTWGGVRRVFELIAQPEHPTVVERPKATRGRIRFPYRHSHSPVVITSWPRF